MLKDFWISNNGEQLQITAILDALLKQVLNFVGQSNALPFFDSFSETLQFIGIEVVISQSHRKREFTLLYGQSTAGRTRVESSILELTTLCAHGNRHS